MAFLITQEITNPLLLSPLSFAPEGQPYGDVVFRRNPYGDAEQIVAQDAPVASKPTQHGMHFMGSQIDPKVDKPAFLETRGPGSEMSPPRGMNTGLGAMGSGPRRNEEMPESRLDLTHLKLGK